MPARLLTGAISLLAALNKGPPSGSAGVVFEIEVNDILCSIRAGLAAVVAYCPHSVVLKNLIVDLEHTTAFLFGTLKDDLRSLHVTMIADDVA